MNGWDKFKIISNFICILLIPIAIAYIGNIHSTSLKERELQGKFVQIAVDILRAEPKYEDKQLREWATQVMNLYSGIDFSIEVKNDLIGVISIPDGLPTNIDKDCSYFLNRGIELYNAGDSIGARDYLKKAEEYCGEKYDIKKLINNIEGQHNN